MEVTAVLFDMGGTLRSYAAREQLGRPILPIVDRGNRRP
ncbi:MAG: hypothetical protein QOD72_2530 [Acidimicrobiaceae bacterium]|nr:hypothetical protein [Acidimicrobiaceae bacterium]